MLPPIAWDAFLTQRESSDCLTCACTRCRFVYGCTETAAQPPKNTSAFGISTTQLSDNGSAAHQWSTFSFAKDNESIKRLMVATVSKCLLVSIICAETELGPSEKRLLLYTSASSGATYQPTVWKARLVYDCPRSQRQDMLIGVKVEPNKLTKRLQSTEHAVDGRSV